MLTLSVGNKDRPKAKRQSSTFFILSISWDKFYDNFIWYHKVLWLNTNAKFFPTFPFSYVCC